LEVSRHRLSSANIGPVSRHLTHGSWRSRFARPSRLASYALVGLGSALSQAVAIVGIPIVSHIYSIDEIGRISLSVALVSTLVTATALRFDIAIPVPSDDLEAGSLTRLALLSAFSSSCLIASFVSVLIFIKPTAFSLTSPQEALLVGAMLLGTSTFSIGSFSLLRRHAYRRLFVLTVVNSLIQYGTQIGLGLLGVNRFGLQIGYALSGMIAGALALRGAVNNYSQSIRATFARYKNYPFHSAPAAVLASLLTQVPTLFSGIQYGTREAALVALTYSGLGSPLAVLSTSVTNTTLAEWGAGRSRDQAEFTRHLRRVALVLFFIASAISIVALGASRAFAGTLLGKEWEDLWKTVGILAPPLVFQNVVSPFGVIPELVGQPVASLRRDIFRVLTLAFVTCITVYIGAGATQGLFLLAIGGIASSMIYYVFSTAPLR
jgi:O-antigen/teichoic acid export membrane protein